MTCWKVNNPCRESVVRLSNIRDMTREPSKVTRHFHEYSEFLCRRRSRVPGRNENRSIARHPRHCDVQYRGSDSTQRDIPPLYDRVPPRAAVIAYLSRARSLTRFRALIGEWIWMEHALIRHFSTRLANASHYLRFHDAYPSTISGCVRKFVRVAFPLIVINAFVFIAHTYRSTWKEFPLSSLILVIRVGLITDGRNDSTLTLMQLRNP